MAHWRLYTAVVRMLRSIVTTWGSNKKQCRTCTLLQLAETYKNGVDKDYRQLGMLTEQFVISCHENKHKALHQKQKQRS